MLEYCPPLTPPQPTSDFFRGLTEGWPWWPWWHSTVGRELRRPTANPRLTSGYRIHVPPRPLAWNPRAPGWLPRAATVPLVQDPFAYEDLRACVHLQISDAAARGLTQGCELASGHTRAVSACTTRATCLAMPHVGCYFTTHV